MDVALDTHIVVWHSFNDPTLTTAAKLAIEEASISDNLIISSITLWEIAWLTKRERIKLKVPYRDYIGFLLKSAPYKVIEINPEIAHIGATFDASISSDPSDRIIAATAASLSIPLVTADNYLRKSTLIKTIW